MATTSWKKAKSGAWEDAKNWSGGVPGQDDVAQIAARGVYTVTLSSKQTIAELDIGAFATLKEEKGGALTTGKIVLDEAKLILDGANPGLTGEIDVTDSTLIGGRQGALGFATIDMNAGAILESKTSTTWSNQIVFSDQADGDTAPAFMAATGRVLELAGAWSLDTDDPMSITFGGKGEGGEIDLAMPAHYLGDHLSVDVVGGILKIATEDVAGSFEHATLTIEKNASLVLGADLFFGNTIDLARGARVDLGGHLLFAGGVNDGLITTSSGHCNLDLESLTGSGKITGDIAIETAGQADGCANVISLTGQGALDLRSSGVFELEGALSIAASGSLSIESNAVLTLASTAKIACSMDLEGDLLVNSSHGKVLLGGEINGAGGVDVENGTIELRAANSSFSGVFGGAGTLLVDDGAGLGTGSTALEGVVSIGTLADADAEFRLGPGATVLEREDVSVANAISYEEGGVIAAATGHIATFTGAVTDDAGGTLVFGAASDTGTIVSAPSSATFRSGQGTYTIEVAAGTLKIGSTSGSLAVNDAGTVTVDAGATLDVSGFNVAAAALAGGGAITTSAGGSLTVYGGTFSGAISGGLLIFTINTVTLSGAGSFTTLEIGNGTTTLGGHASEHVQMIDDPATLALTAGAQLTGTIEGFRAGDKLDLQGLAYQASGAGATSASFDAASHHLTVTTGSQNVVLTLDGSYANGNFTLANDGSGHTLVGYQSIGAPPPHASPPSHAFALPCPAAHADLLHAAVLAPHDPHLAVFA